AIRQADTDDCFQETFLKLHRARATYVSGSDPLHWAFAIARSVYLTRSRYWRRRPEQLGDSEDVASRNDLHPQQTLTPEAENVAEISSRPQCRSLTACPSRTASRTSY